MTVEILIDKLMKCKHSAIVTIENDDLYCNGVYEVTDVNNNENEVEIISNHKNMISEE